MWLTFSFSDSVRQCLFSSYHSSKPYFSFFLWCLFGLLSVISEHCTVINDCLKCGNSSGDPFVSYKLHSCNAKCSQNWSIWETYFFPPILIQKLLTCSLFCMCPLVFIFSSYPCFFFFLRCLFWLPSVISCRSPNIDEHGTFVNTMIAWNLATRGGDPLVNFKLPSLV